MLWVDEFRPRSLDEVSFHVEQAQRLKNLISTGDFPHLLLYGPSGAGKKTRINAVLREIYGPGAERLKLQQMSFKTPSGTDVEITSISSTFHIEITPSDAGFHDRVVVGDVIKNIASSATVVGGPVGFKVVVLNECDSLSISAQHALRRTMEKHSSTCRLILLSTSSSRIIAPLRSRCLCLRIGAPTEEEVISILASVVARHNLPQLPPPLASRIAQASERNLRKALLILESCKVAQFPWSQNQAVELAPWERYVSLIAKEMVQEQSAKAILVIRAKFYELLSRSIPADLILKRLVDEVLRRVDDEMRTEVASLAAVYEHRIRMGTKAIFHLETFVAKFMYVYKKFLVESDIMQMAVDGDFDIG